MITLLRKPWICTVRSILFTSKPQFPPAGTALVSSNFNDHGEGTSGEEERGIFRVLDIGKPNLEPITHRERDSKRIFQKATYFNRDKLMSPNQNWEAVWPAPKTFHPSIVPLPVRQGFAQLKEQVIPQKKGNAELLKVPNFLHLTPTGIIRQCKAIKKFCTPWPEGNLEDEFPITEVSSCYLNSSSSLRDMRARVITLQIPVQRLNLDARSKDKLIRLCRHRYDPIEDVITIVADSCPYKKQNQDYAEYLLIALYHESKKQENWEKSKWEEDLMEFAWPLLSEKKPMIEDHSNSIQNLFREGENQMTLKTYRSSVLKLLEKHSKR